MAFVPFIAATSLPSAPPSNQTTRRRFSVEAENRVAQALVRAGWRLLGRNVRARGCELDIVVQKGSTVAIVEVKARRNGFPDCFRLSPRQSKALKKGALRLLARQGIPYDTIRFDLAMVVKKPGTAWLLDYHVDVLASNPAAGSRGSD